LANSVAAITSCQDFIFLVDQSFVLRFILRPDLLCKDYLVIHKDMVDCGSVLRFQALFKFGEDDHHSNYTDGRGNDHIPAVHRMLSSKSDKRELLL
jgi:hypothetical protein